MPTHLLQSLEPAAGVKPARRHFSSRVHLPSWHGCHKATLVQHCSWSRSIKFCLRPAGQTVTGSFASNCIGGPTDPLYQAFAGAILAAASSGNAVTPPPAGKRRQLLSQRTSLAASALRNRHGATDEHSSHPDTMVSVNDLLVPGIRRQDRQGAVSTAVEQVGLEHQPCAAYNRAPTPCSRLPATGLSGRLLPTVVDEGGAG